MGGSSLGAFGGLMIDASYIFLSRFRGGFEFTRFFVEAMLLVDLAIDLTLTALLALSVCLEL